MLRVMLIGGFLLLVYSMFVTGGVDTAALLCLAAVVGEERLGRGAGRLGQDLGPFSI